MIESIIKRAKERFDSKLANATINERNDVPGWHIGVNTIPEIKDFLETEISAAVREVLEKVKTAADKYDMTEEFDPSEPMLRKINEILNDYAKN